MKFRYCLFLACAGSVFAQISQYPFAGGGGGGTPGGTSGQIQYNNSGAFGGTSAVPVCSAYTVNYNNSTLAAAATTTAAVTLFTLPASAKVTAINIKHSTAFAGTSVTDVTVSVGWSGSATAYSSAFDIFQAVAATTQYDDGGAFSATSASHAITANFTSVGGNLNALTAGAVTINACYYTIPTATVIP